MISPGMAFAKVLSLCHGPDVSHGPGRLFCLMVKNF